MREEGSGRVQKDNRGITLIELIIAIAISTIIVGAATFLLSTAQKNYSSASATIDLQSEAQILMEQMGTWIMEGNRVEGKYNPSSDTATHLELYKAFPELGGVVHTHSPWATSWAQAGRDIPCYGTTHADYMYGPIPCARNLTPEEINGEYEKNTGLVIIETFKNRNINPVYVPAVLCTNHGPFTWGKNAAEAVHNAVVLEEVAKMATLTELNNPKVQPAPDCIKEKHFMRKHGPNAYYGQPGK